MKRTDGSSSNDDAPPGAPASLPYDRTTVERFQKSFPRPAGAVGCGGEPVHRNVLGSQYADFPDDPDYVWGRWRPAALGELIKTWPSRTKTEIGDALWWQPTLDDLGVARRAARGLERRRRRG